MERDASVVGDIASVVAAEDPSLHHLDRIRLDHRDIGARLCRPGGNSGVGRQRMVVVHPAHLAENSVVDLLRMAEARIRPYSPGLHAADLIEDLPLMVAGRILFPLAWSWASGRQRAMEEGRNLVGSEEGVLFRHSWAAYLHSRVLHIHPFYYFASEAYLLAHIPSHCLPYHLYWASAGRHMHL